MCRTRVIDPRRAVILARFSGYLCASLLASFLQIREAACPTYRTIRECNEFYCQLEVSERFLVIVGKFIELVETYYILCDCTR